MEEGLSPTEAEFRAREAVEEGFGEEFEPGDPGASDTSTKLVAAAEEAIASNIAGLNDGAGSAGILQAGQVILYDIILGTMVTRFANYFGP